MSADRELLELAAMAAGIDPDFDGTHSPRHWNPLGDDGEALRLAVQLELVILIDRYFVRIGPRLDYPDMRLDDDLSHAERCSAVRRAIVLTAAKIGASS